MTRDQSEKKEYCRKGEHDRSDENIERPPILILGIARASRSGELGLPRHLVVCRVVYSTQTQYSEGNTGVEPGDRHTKQKKGQKGKLTLGDGQGKDYHVIMQ